MGKIKFLYCCVVGIVFIVSASLGNASLKMDDNLKVFPGEITFSTQDDAGTPITSPVAITTAGITALTVPGKAVTLLLKGDGISVKVSEKSNLSSYFTIDSGSVLVLGVAGTAAVYVQAGSANGNLHFIFSSI